MIARTGLVGRLAGPTEGTAVRKLIVTLLLVSAFLGGYYVGRLPGAPDVFGWAKRSYQLAAKWGSKAADTANHAKATAGPPTGQASAGPLHPSLPRQ